MKNERLILLMLAVTQFTHIVDFMIVMPLGAEFMEIFDITPTQFSWIVSVYALSASVMGLFGAMYIDRYDRKTALLACYIGFIIGTFACAMSSGFVFFLLARAFTGLFGGVLSALVLAIVADITPLERRGQSMGIIMTAFSVASVVGVPLSLWIAALLSWRAPFIAVGSIASIMMLLLWRYMPVLTAHLEKSNGKQPPLVALQNIARDSNQLKALLFSIVLILGHFTIIPFIAPYMELNIGFSKFQIPYIYLVGGILTAILLPLAGVLSDKFGHVRIFVAASIFALFSIYAITNLPPVSIIIALVVTSSYFIASSGRNVPATTMVTSVVSSANRASFMSVRSSANEFALFLGSFIAGLIIKENDDGSLANYEYVGYVAIIMSILAILLSKQLKLKS
jgi:predicted MFS family arabinose efflux permease